MAAPRLAALTRWIRLHRNGVIDAAWAVDQLPFIFDRFRTGDNPRSWGTGLGLPLVAAAHGGTVNVRSKPGEGSEFELLVPIAGEQPALLPVGTGC